MNSLNLRRSLFAVIFVAYVGIFAVVLFCWNTLNAEYYGRLNIERATQLSTTGGREILQVEGQGLNAELRAVVLSAGQRQPPRFFLDGVWGRAFWFDGETLLTSDKFGMLVIMRVDAGNQPQVLGSLKLPNPIIQVAKVGHRAVVALRGDGFWLVDLTDPASPALIGKVPGVDVLSRAFRDMLVDGQTVYAVCGRERMIVRIDLSTDVPVAVSVPTQNAYWRGALHGGRLVVGDLGGAVELFDLKEDGAPRSVGRLSLDAEVRGFGLTDACFTVALGNGELHLFDVSAWPEVVRRSVVTLDRPALDLAPVPGRSLQIIKVATPGLVGLDTSDLAAPRQTPFFRLPTTGHGLRVANDTVVTLSVRDVGAYPLDAVLAGRTEQIVSLEEYDYGLHESAGDVYLMPIPLRRADRDPGPAERTDDVLVPVSSAFADQQHSDETVVPPGMPTQEQSCLALAEDRISRQVHLFCRENKFDLPRRQTTLEFSETDATALWHADRVYVGTYQKGIIQGTRRGELLIYDATTPTRLRLLSKVAVPGGIVSLAWYDPHYLLVAAGKEGLGVFDVSDPAQPARVGSMTLPRHLRSSSRVLNLLVKGEAVFLAHQRSGVSQLDLDTPAAPQIRRSIDTPGYVRGLTEQDGILFVSLYRDGVYMIDVGAGSEWAPIGSLRTPLHIHDLAATASRLFVSGGVNGLASLPLPRRVPVKLLDGRRAQILLPTGLAPGAYHVYLYNGRENLHLDAAVRIVAQKE